MPLLLFFLYFFLVAGCASRGLSLTCYECENCVENEAYLRTRIRQCPDSSYISCLMTESKFAHHKMTSRSCSKAPAVNPDCSNHLVNIMRATVCLCDQPLCNGLYALANFTSSLNSRIFNNNLLLTNNHLNSAVGGGMVSANSQSSANNAASSIAVSKAAAAAAANAVHGGDKGKENFMPLHDFNEQRLAAMLGRNGGSSSLQSLPSSLVLILSHWIVTMIVVSFVCPYEIH